jgi:hypothetical protein
MMSSGQRGPHDMFITGITATSHCEPGDRQRYERQGDVPELHRGWQRLPRAASLEGGSFFTNWTMEGWRHPPIVVSMVRAAATA